MSTTEADRGIAVEIEQEFAAASDRVYAFWTEPEALARWFAPGDYTTVAADVDARPGGASDAEARHLRYHPQAHPGLSPTPGAPRRLEPTAHVLR